MRRSLKTCSPFLSLRKGRVISCTIRSAARRIPPASPQNFCAAAKPSFFRARRGKRCSPSAGRAGRSARGRSASESRRGRRSRASRRYVSCLCSPPTPPFFRLGYGGGYYDRWLARARASGAQVRAIGICYHFQLADKLPAEPHDVPLDALVTDREIRIRKLTEETR